MFGAETCSIVVLNLGSGPLAAAAKYGIVADLALTFPIALAAAKEALELALFTDATPHLSAKRSALAVALVAGSYVFTFVPGFSTIVNVVGAWSVTLFSFIVPPLMLLQLRRFHAAALRKSRGASEDADVLQSNLPKARHALRAIAFDPYTAQLLVDPLPPCSGSLKPLLRTHSLPPLRPSLSRCPLVFCADGSVVMLSSAIPQSLRRADPHSSSVARLAGAVAGRVVTETVLPLRGDSCSLTLPASRATSLSLAQHAANPKEPISVRVSELHYHSRHHTAALEIMGVGSATEACFLILVALFGCASLVASTAQSIQAAVASGGAGDACYATT